MKKAMMLNLIAVLVLAIPAQAEELKEDFYYDGGTRHAYWTTLAEYCAVDFSDQVDTWGTVTSARVNFTTPFRLTDVKIYIFPDTDGEPDHENPLFEDTWDVHSPNWQTYTFPEPQLVPREFYIGLSFNSDDPATDSAATDNGPTTFHSWMYFEGEGWYLMESPYFLEWNWIIRCNWEADEDPPYVEEVSPADGEADVPLDAVITFHCKDDTGYATGIDVDSVDINVHDDTLLGGRAIGFDASNRSIAGELELDDGDLTDVLCTFTPYDGLIEGTIVTCTVDGGLADRGGNEMGDDFVWSFTTVGYQSVVNTTWGCTKARY